MFQSFLCPIFILFRNLDIFGYNRISYRKVQVVKGSALRWPDSLIHMSMSLMSGQPILTKVWFVSEFCNIWPSAHYNSWMLLLAADHPLIKSYTGSHVATVHLTSPQSLWECSAGSVELLARVTSVPLFCFSSSALEQLTECFGSCILTHVCIMQLKGIRLLNQSGTPSMFWN